MRVDKKRADGIKVVHGGGELAITDRELDLSIALPSLGKSFTEDHLLAIEAALEDHEEVVFPIISITRVDAIFARLDMGGYWSPWVVGETLEDVMEQLDDLYGVYDDYL
jgi:hypothetical protein